MSDVILTEEQQKGLVDTVKEILVSMARIDAEKQHIKDILDEASKKLEINKKYIRKVATTVHAEKAHDFFEENEILEAMINIVEENL